MPTGDVLLETDEPITEQALHEAFWMLGLSGRVVDGLDPGSGDVDTSANTIDMPSGEAVITDDARDPPRNIPIAVDAETGVSLPETSSDNWVYLTYAPTDTDTSVTDDLEWAVQSSESAPSDPSLLVAKANAGSGAVTLYNRSPELTAETPFVVTTRTGSEKARVADGTTTLDKLSVTNAANLGSLTGSLANSDEITNLVGSNLSVDSSGNLNASGGSGGTGFRQVGSNGEVSLFGANTAETVVARWPGQTDTTYQIKSLVLELQDGGTNANVTLRVYDGSTGGTMLESTTAGSSSFGLSTNLSSGNDIVLTLESTDGSDQSVAYDVEFDEV